MPVPAPTSPNKARIVLPALHPGQMQVLREAEGARYKVCALGRRFGKTYLCHDLAANPIIDGQPVGYFCPDYKRLLEFWQGMKTLLSPIITRSSDTEHRIETLTGGLLECWTLQDEDAGRSRKYARIIIDEAGLVADLGARWDDAIRPTLADLRGDAWLMGTPKGRNFFWQAFTRGQDNSRPAWRSWQMPSHTNPYLSKHELAEMQSEMPDRSYRQEVLAEFLEDGGGVFRGVRGAATLQPGSYNSRHEYVIGVDWGRVEDYTVFSVLDATTNAQVHLDRFNAVDYVTAANRLLALCEVWHPTEVWPESNSIGTPIIDALVRRGVPIPNMAGFTTTAASKQRIIDALALAFERREITLLEDETQTAELEAFTSSVLPGGGIRYAAPEGFHDDTVMALALAWDRGKHERTVRDLEDEDRDDRTVHQLPGMVQRRRLAGIQEERGRSKWLA